MNLRPRRYSLSAMQYATDKCSWAVVRKYKNSKYFWTESNKSKTKRNKLIANYIRGICTTIQLILVQLRSFCLMVCCFRTKFTISAIESVLLLGWTWRLVWYTEGMAGNEELQHQALWLRCITAMAHILDTLIVVESTATVSAPVIMQEYETRLFVRSIIRHW
jgi:hypothetical protein